MFTTVLTKYYCRFFVSGSFFAICSNVLNRLHNFFFFRHSGFVWMLYFVRIKNLAFSTNDLSHFGLVLVPIVNQSIIDLAYYILSVHHLRNSGFILKILYHLQFSVFFCLFRDVSVIWCFRQLFPIFGMPTFM